MDGELQTEGFMISAFCPICGRLYCDHTPEQRHQNSENMDAILRTEEDFIKWFGKERGMEEYKKRKS